MEIPNEEIFDKFKSFLAEEIYKKCDYTFNCIPSADKLKFIKLVVKPVSDLNKIRNDEKKEYSIFEPTCPEEYPVEFIRVKGYNMIVAETEGEQIILDKEWFNYFTQIAKFKLQEMNDFNNLFEFLKRNTQTPKKEESVHLKLEDLKDLQKRL